MAFVALSNIPHQPYIMLGIFVVIQYLYQISLIFYNALLKNVSSEKNRGQIAGLGDGMGSLGRLVALPIFLPIISCTVVWFGSPGKTQVFLPAFLLSTIFMVPLLLRFKEGKMNKIEHQENIYRQTRQGIRKLFTTHKNV